jgi:hypothetical protein
LFLIGGQITVGQQATAIKRTDLLKTALPEMEGKDRHSGRGGTAGMRFLAGIFGVCPLAKAGVVNETLFITLLGSAAAQAIGGKHTR